MDNFGFSDGTGAGDPFSKFWSDMTAKMTAAGMPQPFAANREDMMKQTRQAFFDAWAKYCEEFLGSPAFLDAMKQSMDGALAFKQQVNDFLTKSVENAPIASREDADSILEAVRGMERRVLDRVDKLSQRVEKLESAPSDSPASSRSTGKRQTKGKGQ